MNNLDVIIRPIITEESMKVVPVGKYTFVVARKATKDEIKKAVSQLFNVTVLSVATSVVKGKTKRIGQRRVEVVETASKKAIVKVKEGDKIYLFEPGGEEAHEHKK